MTLAKARYMSTEASGCISHSGIMEVDVFVHMSTKCTLAQETTNQSCGTMFKTHNGNLFVHHARLINLGTIQAYSSMSQWVRVVCQYVSKSIRSDFRV